MDDLSEAVLITKDGLVHYLLPQRINMEFPADGGMPTFTLTGFLRDSKQWTREETAQRLNSLLLPFVAIEGEK